MKSIFKHAEITLALVAGVVSVGGLFVSSIRTLVGTLDKSLSITSILIGLTLGLAAPLVAENLRHLQRARRVFLSYSANDNDVAMRLRDQLQASGMKVWVAADRVLPGMAIRTAIDKAIRDADAVVVLLPRQHSEWLSYEVGAALSRGVRVLPVLVSDADPPKELRDIAFVDARTGEQEAFQHVVASLA